jgi:endonuclease/exonuclease/phosphatase (EEP) superfamily protein YafD
LNLHVINFTLGVRAMQQQLAPTLQLIEHHEGPVILSGDFNTWSGARERTLAKAFGRLGLEPIAYRTDHRKRIFGRAVDHVWVRGIDAGAGMSHAVETSDHNPVWVDLSVDDAASTGTRGREGSR